MNGMLAKSQLGLGLVLLGSPVVAAFDTGDAIALVIGLILAFIILCACLGWYSRRV